MVNAGQLKQRSAVLAGLQLHHEDRAGRHVQIHASELLLG